VHRIGRTGRAGKVGRAITLVTSEDIMSLYAIEEHIGAMIAEAELPSDAVVNEHRNRPIAQPKPVQAIAKPVPPHSTEPDAAAVKDITAPVQSQDSTSEKPFLQRVLKRILGK
jgi:superfamily II DNA/RNA helicase